MRKFKMAILCLVVGIFALTGCAILNPYSSSFQCPDYKNGKCTSVKTAYEEDTGKQPAGMTADKGKASDPKSVASRTPDGRASESEYQKEVYGKLSSLLRSPKTPMVTPPKVMRVLLMPYKGEGDELYMARYAYVKVDDAKWVMGDYLMDDPSGEEE